MSLPEISRRCLSCGASVRAGARFCPQCGSEMKDSQPAKPGGEAVEPGAERSDTAVVEAPATREIVAAFESWKEEVRVAPGSSDGAERLEAEAGIRAQLADEERAPQPSGVPPADSAAEEEEAGPDALQTGHAGLETRRRRAGAVVKENIMPRVERMREEALVVLEESPDDAGLRFVAVAVALFLLFLLLLFLSTVLK